MSRRYAPWSIACAAALLTLLAPGVAHMAPPPPPALVSVAQTLTAPDARNPALAMLPGGIAVTQSDLLRWIDDSGGSPRDFDTADAETRTEMLCGFVDDLDLGTEQLAMTRPIALDVDRAALWRETLIRAAYRDLVDPATADDSLRTPAVRIARLQTAMAAIGPRPSNVPVDRFAADPRLDPALVRHAIANGFATRPTVADRYRRTLFTRLAQARKAAKVSAAAERYARDPTVEIDAGRSVRTGARPACLPDGQPVLTFVAAQRAGAHRAFLDRSVTLDIRRRSRSTIIQNAGQPPQ